MVVEQATPVGRGSPATLTPVLVSARPRLNIGCGPLQPDGWVNIDNSNRAKLASRVSWLDRLLVMCRLLPPTEFGANTVTQNVQKRLGYANNSVEAIYGGEVLEHFTHEQGQRFLAECYRVLAPGGVVRLRVPDNYRFWKNYVTAAEAMLAKPAVEWNDEHTRWIRMFFRDICVRRQWFTSMGHFHKWMYDEISLVLAFRHAGFIEVERRKFLDSRIPDVAAVERRDDLIVEGIKPTVSD